MREIVSLSVDLELVLSFAVPRDHRQRLLHRHSCALFTKLACNDAIQLLEPELDNALDLNLARGVAPSFRLEKSAAKTIVAEVAEAVIHWRAVATHHAISRAEQNRMQLAFAPLE